MIVPKTHVNLLMFFLHVKLNFSFFKLNSKFQIAFSWMIKFQIVLSIENRMSLRIMGKRKKKNLNINLLQRKKNPK